MVGTHPGLLCVPPCTMWGTEKMGRMVGSMINKVYSRIYVSS